MTVHTWCTDLSCCWGSCTMRNAQVQHAQQRVPRYARSAGLPCVRRVTIVLHRFMAQVFEIVLTCCGTDQHEGGSCVAAFSMDEFATAWEQVTRSEYIDLLRTRLGFVDRARFIYIFTRRIKLRGGYHLAHADLLHVRTVFHQARLF